MSTLQAVELGSLITIGMALYYKGQALLRWLSRLLLVEVSVDSCTASVVTGFLTATARVGKTYRHYETDNVWVKSAEAFRYVLYRCHLATPQRFLTGRRGGKGLRPIWSQPVTAPLPNRGEDATVTGSKYFYIRGSVDWEKLICVAAKWATSEREKNPYKYRHFITFVSGSAGSAGLAEASTKGESNVPGRARDFKGGDILLNYAFEDVGYPQKRTLDGLVLGVEAQGVLDESRRWYKLKHWYSERGIAWRRNYALVGPPGTGKTALARAVAEDLDLPVHVFDLATMTNRDLRSAWSGVQDDDGAVVVLEDFDRVFLGSDPAHEHIRLTFDAILNVLDGMSRDSGVLVFITTNHPETLDPALMRPGRIDRMVTLNEPDEFAYRKIAEKILGKGHAQLEDLVRSASKERLTHASFQEVLVRIATRDMFPEDD